ncbi:SpoIIE family protein phosphatase [bacterium]|nr:SpoIIE family protein phosphatase [candidate division CSSED10-310 bacterium]
MKALYKKHILAVVVVMVLCAVLAGLDIQIAGIIARILATASFIALLAILSRSLYQRLLWSVRRRLAFSYFLIGVLPVPMANFLLILALYLLSCFFLRNIYQNSVDSLSAEMHLMAEARLGSFALGQFVTRDRELNLSYAYYRDGTKVVGDDRLPMTWPLWLFESSTEPAAGQPDHIRMNSFLLLEDGTVTPFAAAESPSASVLACFDGDVARELSERSTIRVELRRVGRERTGGGNPLFKALVFSFKNTSKRELSSETLWGVAAYLFLKMLDWRNITWGESSNQLLAYVDGHVTQEPLMAVLKSSPFVLLGRLVASSGETYAASFLFIGIGLILLIIYSLAVIYALFLIFRLSRAVNRISKATNAVQQGRFSHRIPVRRIDQVGDLQHSFNRMAERLETLVAESAQKEILENELRVARDLQQSLLPEDLPRDESIEFATLFEPSAAIGGDYFDVIKLKDERTAIVIADVSGHGLPAGLRMAMLKAALHILLEEEKSPEEIFKRLDDMVRANRRERFFITMTFALFDRASGMLELINAGHPPTYLVRDGGVDEILLPSSPLGGLGTRHRQQSVRLQPDDSVIWLSDGFIEAVNAEEHPFGYNGVMRALSGHGNAQEVKRRFIKAFIKHVGKGRVEDDRTMVVMHLNGTGSSRETP